MSKDVEFNDKGLKDLMKALSKAAPQGRLGVLGGKNLRGDPDNSNAMIGQKHEFGIDVPQRSFLRAPLIENMQKYLDKAGAFDKAALKKVVQSKSIVEWVKKVCIVGEAIVADAFDSGGFGKWAPLSPRTLAMKKNQQILVETQQLRNSITSEVKE